MRPTGFLAFLLIVGLPGVGCARMPPNPASNSCRNACASMICPTGTVCTLGDRCAPRCQPLPVSRR